MKENGRLCISKQIGPDTYFVSYSDFLLPSLGFTDWTFSEDELKGAIGKVQAGEQLVWDHFQEKRSPRKSRNLKERVLDYDTWDKYYDEGAEAYFEGKTLDEVPITGNAWFREAWEEGWKMQKLVTTRMQEELKQSTRRTTGSKEGVINKKRF